MAKNTLLLFDLTESSDSIDCAIASNPDDALIFFVPERVNFGIKKYLFGCIIFLSTVYLVLFIYIIAFGVTSAPEPDVVGMAIKG